MLTFQAYILFASDILIKDGAGQAEPRKQVTLAGATTACDVYSWGIKRRSLHC